MSTEPSADADHVVTPADPVGPPPAPNPPPDPPPHGRAGRNLPAAIGVGLRDVGAEPQVDSMEPVAGK